MDQLFLNQPGLTGLGIMILKYSKKFTDGALLPRMSSELFPFEHNKIWETVNMLESTHFIQFIDNKVYLLARAEKYLEEYNSYLGNMASVNLGFAILFFLNEFGEKINGDSFPEILKKKCPETTTDYSMNLSRYLISNSYLRPYVDNRDGFFSLNRDGKIYYDYQIESINKMKEDSDLNKNLQLLQQQYLEKQLEIKELTATIVEKDRIIIDLRNSIINMDANKNVIQSTGDNAVQNIESKSGDNIANNFQENKGVIAVDSNFTESLNQSFLSEENSSLNPLSTTKRSLAEKLYWIAGIIVAVILLYEFVLKHFILKP